MMDPRANLMPQANRSSIVRLSIIQKSSTQMSTERNSSLVTRFTQPDSIEGSAIMDSIPSSSESNVSSDTSKDSSPADLPDTDIDYECLLKDKIIRGQYKAGRKHHSDAMLRMARTEKIPCHLKIAPCSPQQLSKMGKRKVPMHEVSDLFGLPVPCTSANQILRRLNPRPRCSKYESWLQQKMYLQDRAFDILTVEDLLSLQCAYRPGDVTLAMAFDQLGEKNFDSSASNLPALV